MGLVLFLAMFDIRSTLSPTIIYRPMRPSDLEALEQIHAALFPVRYEREFFLNVVTGQGIVSWAAVDISRSDGQNDEPIGFVTARIITAKESEIEDLLRSDISRKDQSLVYILTLGVVESYRKLGIGYDLLSYSDLTRPLLLILTGSLHPMHFTASSLIREVINYASSIRNCIAVYLHVIAFNHPAIHFYKKMLFKLIRRLPSFYYINGQHYDSYLFVYFISSGQSPCSPLQVAAAIVAYLRGLYKSLFAKIWKNEKQLPRWFHV